MSKIRVISVERKLIDIQNISLFELDLLYDDHPEKSNFMLVAASLQKYHFIYDDLDLAPLVGKSVTPDTVLVRYLLYNPDILPVLDSKKSTYGTLYTRSPIKKECILNDNIISVPVDEPIYIKQFINKISKQVYDLNMIPILLQQFRHDFILNSFVNIYKIEKVNYVEYIPYKEYTKIKSWFSLLEQKYIKYLLNDERQWVYNLDPMESLGSNNLYLLLYAITEGIQHKKIKEYFQLKEIESNRKQEIVKADKDGLKYANIAKRYISIIDKKFGSVIYRNILFNLSKGKYLRLPGGSMAIPTLITNVTDPDLILSFLSSEQQKIVIAEYKNEMEYIKSILTNKCPHIGIYKRLISSKKIVNTKRYYEMIQDFIRNYNTDFIICYNCNYPILCKHKYEKIGYEINNLSQGEIANKLMVYSIKIKINNINEYYCKICGEKLVNDFYIDDKEIRTKHSTKYNEYEAEIDQFMWSVILKALSQTKNLYINEKKVTKFILDSIRPIIYKKINSTLNDKNRISIILYIYSYLLHAIKNQKIIFFNLDIKNTPITKIAERIIAFISNVYKSIILNSTYSIDKIKLEFNECYKSINKEIDTIIPTTNIDYIIANFIFSNGIFSFARTIYKILSKSDKKYDILSDKIKYEFENIMGRPLPTIVKQYKESNKNIYSTILEINDSNNILNKFIKGDTSLYLFATYIMICKFIKNAPDYLDYYTKFKPIEDNILINKQTKLTSVNALCYQNTNQFVLKNVLITRLYDENGKKHKWNKYLYDTNHILIDIQCSVCNIKQSEIEKLDIKKTKKSINAISNINAFFAFYKERCPEGELHDWVNNSCNKCSLNVDTIESNDALKYYDKYIQMFNNNKDMEKESDAQALVPDTLQSMKNSIIDKFIDNYSLVIKLASLMKIDPYIIQSIGLTEDVDYNEIIAGRLPNVEQYHLYNTQSELIYLLSKVKNPIKNTYIKTFNSMLNKESNKNIHNFLIQSICEIILDFYNIDDKSASDIFNVILLNQRLLAKPVVVTVESANDDIVYLGEDIIGEESTKNEYSVDLKMIDYDFTEDNPNNELNIEYPNEYIYS